MVIQWLRLHTSNAVGTGLIPGGEFKIPHTSRSKSQNTEQKQYCEKFSKDLKSGSHQKKSLKIKKQTHRHGEQTNSYQWGEGRVEEQDRVGD